ncbi:hypothetical protein AGDE_00719 [Angomonas deanei]|uniref:Uncharacterized protein n=1 Tax=Angomonas deanei TaxID=59799 RepID=A0A7G2C7Q9_9TRYP|nr:hypothetical protein AGDE_00719 [Angomonas deanei]CAD2214773.1 Microtubule-binding stalk of dynein motor/ATP-binding dynein motor region/Dynein heavy chain region D6 P-loop domain/Dynein heavy chain AAA lid domain/Dynein heavy chain C-terminal domain containing protein, putative [Angomonas deanei]|eukprot:EPY43203.1 hypothetical protein AGDE_00719 [Angomonas deanei]
MHKGFGDKFSPQHFKVLCLTYESIFTKKSDEVTNGVNRLKTGVAKLDEAQANVDTIASDVGQKKELLEVKQKEADEALKEIQAKMEEASEQRRGIHKVQKELDKEQQAIKERKVVIEGRLSGIQPVLDSARSAVSSIRSEHLSELKSMKQPPAAVQDVMEGVVILISSGGGADTTWAGIRKVLAGDIKGQILNFDLDNVDAGTRDKVDKFIESKNNSFKKEVIGRASKAAAPMAEWLKAVIEYSKVLETVAPMRNELKEYEENLRHAQEKKGKYEGKLAKVEEKVEKLKNRFAEKTTEAERLRSQLEQAEHLLNNAVELITKLSSEHKRWEEQVKSLTSELDLLPKRCLLASGFVTYLGSQPENTREQTLKEWGEKVKLTEFNFFKFLREESVQLHYKSEGLPGDELSMDNAVIIQEQIGTPLIEDPSGLATEWLYNHLKAKGDVVERCSVSEDRLVSTLELALRFGKKLLITDVDKVEPFIYPILRKEIHNEGTKRVIQIGDRRTVDYADGFQLYLITRSTDMQVPPDILSYLTPISFSITLSGLEGQFLGITIQHEQPELEKEKLSVLQKEESLKMQLADLEQSLLSDLASAEGSLLENVGLIESLNKIKSQASEITEALAKSKEVQEEIDNKRNVYRPFAAVASRVFFLTKNLSELSHMYQFSFNLFMNIFKKTLVQHKELRTDPETKIAALQKTFIQITVHTISGSLMKEHRVVFGIHLARALFEEQCTKEEWEYFLDKAIAPDAKKKDVRVPNFVLPDSIDTFRTFGALFPDLVGKIRLQEADVWLEWMRTSSPETDYPSFLQSLTLFQKLLVMKTFRPDRLTAAMNLVACELLNVDSLADNESLATFISRTDASTPVLLITSAGADPSLELQNIAHSKVGKEKFSQLAMGGGQTDAAMELVKRAAEKGEWVFLKNLHLVIPWVYELQKELTTLKLNDNFRLFLTTEPHNEFPSILLSQCLKISFETPPGIRQNLLRTYSDWGKASYDERDDKQKELLFITASLHAIIQERRSYTPQGWTKMYEITASDLKSATDIVLRQSKGEIDWKSIQGLLDNAIYGGKMETLFDTRILATYVKNFFRPSSLSSAKKQDPIFHHVRVPGGSYSDYVKLIKELPDNDTPALFALPPNADRVVQLSRVREVIDNLLAINETREEQSLDREEWVAKLTPILTTWSTLVSQYPDVLTKPTAAFSLSEAKPIEGFLFAEAESAFKLITMVNASVEELKKVAEGTTLLTEDRKAEAAAMIIGSIPPQWDGFFPSNEKLLPWMQSVIRRSTAIAQFQKSSSNGVLLKAPFNISLLFRPQTFLNALRQETAHLEEKPLVNLKLVSSLTEAPAGAKLPVCLDGVLLQGAVTDATGKLMSVETADEAAVAPIQKVFIAWQDHFPEADTARVSLPLYSNTTKENYICDMALPCASEEAASQFILAGAAVVLEK